MKIVLKYLILSLFPKIFLSTNKQTNKQAIQFYCMDAQHFRSVHTAVLLDLAIHLHEIYQSTLGKYYHCYLS